MAGAAVESALPADSSGGISALSREHLPGLPVLIPCANITAFMRLLAKLLLLALAVVLAVAAAGWLFPQRTLSLFQNLMAQLPLQPSLMLPYPAPPSPDVWKAMTAEQRMADVRERVQPLLEKELAAKNLRLGLPAFIRIFKESRELELWQQPQAGRPFVLFRNYPIACCSGALGPKTKEGDLQAPEGFYAVTKKLLNPASRYHLAFNIGYPNARDRSLCRTGSLIMVHGDKVSIGCFAMTDPVIEEIYLIVEAALNGGQAEAPVHSFPFRMTEERMAAAEAERAQWLEFWKSIKPVHDAFEAEKSIGRLQ